MNDPAPPTPSPPPPPAVPKWRVALKRWWPAVAGLALLTAFLNDGLDLRDRMAGTGTTTPSGVAIAASGGSGNLPAPPPSEAHQSSTARTPGQCLSGGGTSVSCALGHGKEVIGSASGCSESTLFVYLGGRTDIDVLNGRITAAVEGRDEAAACVATIGPPTVSGTIAKTLGGPAGDNWRRCYESTTDRDVPCSAPHDGEYVAWSSSTATVDCGQAADLYVGRPYSKLSDLLLLRTVVTSDHQACRLELRVNSRLTGTLRGLGARALPLDT